MICRNDKLIEETKQNNIDDVNNVEHSGQETEQPVQENPPAPAPSPTPPPLTALEWKNYREIKGKKWSYTYLLAVPLRMPAL